MTKFEDNLSPYLTVVEQGSTPANPSAGNQKLFVRTSDHLLCYLNSSGTVTAFGAGAATTVTAHVAKVYRDTSDQSLGNNTFTAIQWNQSTTDTDSGHSNVTNNTRYTVQSISGVTTGAWRFTTRGYTSATSGRADVKFKKNGTTDSEITVGMAGFSGVVAFQATYLIVLSATDYIEVYVRTTTGNFNLVATDSTALPQFEVEFLGKVT